MDSDTVALIRQAISNVVNRIRKLEAKQQIFANTFTRKPALSTITLVALPTPPAVVEGTQVALDPGVYLVTCDFEFQITDNNDSSNYSAGAIMLNGRQLPGTARIMMLRVTDNRGFTFGTLQVISYTWLLTLWDYRQLVLDSLPSLYLRLDDANTFAAAIAVDSSGAGQYGTYNGQPTPRQPSPITAGDLGLNQVYSILLNGTTDYIVASGAGVITAAGGIAIAFKTSTAAIQALIGMMNISTLRDGVGLWLDATGHVVGAVASGAASSALTSPLAYNDGRWHLAEFVWSGGPPAVLNLFVDGALVASGTYALAINLANPLHVGHAPAGTAYFFNGNLAEAAVYQAEQQADIVRARYVAAVGQSILPDTLYVDEVLADSPTAFYRLDDTLGLVMLDRSPNLRAGAYSATGILLNQDGAIIVEADGTYNPCARFDGTNGRATASDAGMPTGNADRTIECWIYCTALPTANPAWLAGYGGDPAIAQQAFWLYLDTAGILGIASSAGATPCPATNAIVLNRWYHVVGKNSGNNLTLYINGYVEATGTTALATILGGTFSIGRSPAAANPRAFTGLIDDVSLMPSALSDARVQTRYRAGRSTRGFLQMLAYKQDGTGTTWLIAANTKMVVERLFPMSRS